MPTFKNPNQLSDAILNSDNKDLDVTGDVDTFFAKYPKKENESLEDYDERVYSPYANEFGNFIQRPALNDIYDRALKKAYFGDYIDADYERSYGAVDTDEKYQAYLKWLKQGN